MDYYCYSILEKKTIINHPGNFRTLIICTSRSWFLSFDQKRKKKKENFKFFTLHFRSFFRFARAPQHTLQWTLWQLISIFSHLSSLSGTRSKDTLGEPRRPACLQGFGVNIHYLCDVASIHDDDDDDDIFSLSLWSAFWAQNLKEPGWMWRANKRTNTCRVSCPDNEAAAAAVASSFSND